MTEVRGADVRQGLGALHKHWKGIGLVTLVALVAGVALVGLRAPSYRSATSLLVVRPQYKDELPADTGRMDVLTLKDLCLSPSIAGQVLRKLQQGDVAPERKAGLADLQAHGLLQLQGAGLGERLQARILVVEETNVSKVYSPKIDLYAEGPTPPAAQLLADTWAQVFLATVREKVTQPAQAAAEDVIAMASSVFADWARAQREFMQLKKELKIDLLQEELFGLQRVLYGAGAEDEAPVTADSWTRRLFDERVAGTAAAPRQQAYAQLQQQTQQLYEEIVDAEAELMIASLRAVSLQQTYRALQPSLDAARQSLQLDQLDVIQGPAASLPDRQHGPAAGLVVLACGLVGFAVAVVVAVAGEWLAGVSRP